MSEVQTTTPVQKPKPKFPIAAIIGIIIFLLLAGGAAASFTVFKLQILKLVSKPTPTPTVIPNLTRNPVIPTPNPTANWKTYKDTDYNFSVQYPSEWGVASGNTTDYNNLKMAVVGFGPFLSEFPNTHLKTAPHVSTRVTVGVMKNTDYNKSIQEVLTPIFNISQEATPIWSLFHSNGLEGTKLIHNGCQNSDCTSYFLRKNGYIYEISGWGAAPTTVNQILSTFKFTN